MKIHMKSDIKNLFFRIHDDDVMALSAQLAYSFLLSFFPFLIFLMTLIGHSSINSSDALAYLSNIVPGNAMVLVKSTVVEVVDTRNSNLLSLSLLFTIWTSSSGFKAVIKGLNKAYDTSETRSFLRLEIIALLSTIALTTTIILTLVLLVLGKLIGTTISMYVAYPNQFMDLWNALRYVVILASMVFVFAAMYRYTPCTRLHWGEVLPGAIFSTLGWIIISAGFSFYVNNFGNYSRIYGSIGVVIILLTWLFLTSLIIMLGGEINATFAFDMKGQEKPHGKDF